MHAPSIYSALACIGFNKPKLIVCEESPLMQNTLLKNTFLFFNTYCDYLIVNSFNEKKLIKNFRRFNKKGYLEWFDTKSIKFNPSPNKSKGINKILVVGRVAYPKMD